MSSLIRSPQFISQVLRDKAARVGLVRNFYTGLMRVEEMKSLLDQAVADGLYGALKGAARYFPTKGRKA